MTHSLTSSDIKQFQSYLMDSNVKLNTVKKYVRDVKKLAHFLSDQTQTLSQNSLDAFLKYFPAVRKIVLCLDNDNAGRTRTQNIIAHLAGSGKAVEDRPPPVGKDYNDTLVQYMQEYRAHCISMDDILEETR